MAKKILKKAQTGRQVGAGSKDSSFKKDSTNLDSATRTYGAMRKRFGDASPKSITGDVGDKYNASIDSIKSIGKRRSGDSEFWKKVTPSKKKGGTVKSKKK